MIENLSEPMPTNIINEIPHVLSKTHYRRSIFGRICVCLLINKKKRDAVSNNVEEFKDLLREVKGYQNAALDCSIVP